MEGNSSLSDIMNQQLLSDFQDLQAPFQFHHHSHLPSYQLGSEVQPQSNSVFPVEYTQEQAVSVLNYNENERGKSLVSDDCEMNCAATDVDGHIEVDEERGTPWQRSKWNEKMVKLLITAVSYIGQHAPAETGSSRTESSHLPKIRKWKIVSKIMNERGYNVSPQQCEDKFNNLNKKYKRLNEVLGKGTSCNVVENPKLLDEMDISEKEKEEVQRLLSSKQLFYREMCSYHNGNQLFLPYDPDLEWCLHLALSGEDEPHSKWSKAANEQDRDAIADSLDNKIENEDIGGMFVFPEVPLTVSGKEGIDELQKQWMASRSCQLKLQKLQVKAQLLKLEKEKYKWQVDCWKPDRELNKMRLQNESLKIENERLETELTYKKMSAHYSTD